MASLGLVNIGALATGILASPRLDADAILVEHGRIAALGAGSRTGAGGADVVVDCRSEERRVGKEGRARGAPGRYESGEGSVGGNLTRRNRGMRECELRDL